MLINIETNLSLKELNTVLSQKNCYKYPFISRKIEYNLGINWISNHKKFICLFYEDGTTDRWGYQTTVKPFFYGKVLKIKGKNKIVGICCPNVTFVLLTLSILFTTILCSGGFTYDLVFDLLLFFVIVTLFYWNIPEHYKKIKDYLEKQFR